MEQKLSSDDTALIVVDMQNDFAHPDGELYAEPSGDAVRPIKDLVTRASENDVPVVYTQDVHTDEQFSDATYYDEYERWGRHVEKGSWGAQILDELEPEEFADKIVRKHTYDAFFKTELDSWLNVHGIENVVICGTLANVCVMHTSAGAGLRDFRPIIVEDALGYLKESDRDYAVEHTDWLYGEAREKESISFN